MANGKITHNHQVGAMELVNLHQLHFISLNSYTQNESRPNSKPWDQRQFEKTKSQSDSKQVDINRKSLTSNCLISFCCSNTKTWRMTMKRKRIERKRKTLRRPSDDCCKVFDSRQKSPILLAKVVKCRAATSKLCCQDNLLEWYSLEEQQY